MRVGILGCARMGGKLGTLFARARHEVTFSYSRDRKKLESLAPTRNAVVARLIRDVGFDPLDVGALEMARSIEPFTLLVAEIAYEGDGGPALTYRFEHLEELD